MVLVWFCVFVYVCVGWFHMYSSGPPMSLILKPQFRDVSEQREKKWNKYGTWFGWGQREWTVNRF